MTVLALLQQELEKEAQTTRKMLSIVPADQFDWQPHPKSMTLRSLSTHVAELPTWVRMVLETEELDFEKNPYSVPKINTTAELVDFFEKNLLDSRDALATADVSTFDKPWTLRAGETIYSSDPKIDVLRMTFSQIIHHRAQLGVFLRLLNIPIPGSYGPSADDMSFA
ncbi:DinB family protein [Flectobacillus longus]|uniref:DinB family protein n=1 Tax=Flectobacillus longus TaxID=2984207 RepID=UPI0024B6907D|nr:DinB family protein [Flectobacillus longus]MDI9882094.1 DinB family protein [Flectobacillus longus]